MGGRSLSSGFLVVLLVFGVFVAAVDFVGAQTSSVKGMLTSDTTWSKAGSPYVLEGVVGVAEGVTLTVEPGVTVNFGSYYLEVKGTLCVRGTTSEKIVFEATEPLWSNKRILFTDSSTGWNEQTETGSIIENANLNFISLSIGHTSPKICMNYFNYPSIGDLVYVTGGSPAISNNTMIFDGDGINVYSGSPVISDNYIEGASNTGISTGDNSGETIIVRNTIINNCYGVKASYATQTIEGNLFNNNQVGIWGGGTILNNTIENSEIAIRRPLSPSIIRYNNIVGYSQNSIYMKLDCSEVDATYNWWGTTDAEAIAQSIYDFEDDYNLAKVNFEPFLTEPNPAITSPVEGPSHPVTPTPTPQTTPEPYTPTGEAKLALECSSSTSSSDFKVDVSGSLTVAGAGVANAPITLSYSLDNGATWGDFATVNTGSQGAFAAVWVPSGRGNYLVKAFWAGDAHHAAVSTTVTFAVEPSDEQNVFSVATNSTMTELFFDSANNELRFRVEGPDGTTGYAKVYISKTFLNDTSGLKVYLDDNELSHTIESNDDSWVLAFSYTHSDHQVTINLGSAVFDISQIGQALVIGLPILVVVLLLVVTKLSNRKSKTDTVETPEGGDTD